MGHAKTGQKVVIRTPDQRLRVFVSSTLMELAAERASAKKAISHIRLNPVMFEMGARPHPPRELYRAYLEQSHIFIGIYWQNYGWIAPDMDISGIEDEFNLSEGMPRLIYLKQPAKEIDNRLQQFLLKIENEGLSYKFFTDANELGAMIEDDLAVLLTERFEMTNNHDVPVANLNSQKRKSLPVPPTPLIGREKQIETLCNLLLKSDIRLVTLSGPGGIGKTRLALEVAGQLQNRFPDGVYFVPLAHIKDVSLVPDAIVQSLFPGQPSARPPEDIILTELSDKNALILIDNFEQVVDSAGFIAFMIMHCPDIKILITSRELLRISGETEFAVAPLSIPDFKEDLQSNDKMFDEISRSAAVQLFVERAAAIKPGFSLTKENAAAIAEICIKLDGIPLAVELAAARSKILSPREMLPHLNRSLNLLTSGTRDMPERHRKLYATIDWSYHLLDEGEQQLLSRLSVFSGGCDLDSAWAVTAANENPDMGEWARQAMYLRNPAVPPPAPYPEIDLAFVQQMESLVNKNLLYTQESAHGETRFYLFETIREYAKIKLNEHGNDLQLQKNHLVYFLRMAEESCFMLHTGVAYKHFHKLDREMGNMRAAMANAMELFPALGLRVAVGLGEYWDTKSMSTELKWWIENLLTATEINKEDYPPMLPEIAKGELSRAYFREGDYLQTKSLAGEIMEKATSIGNRYIYLDAVLLRCLVAAYVFDEAVTANFAEDGLSLARELNYTIAEIDMLQNITAATTIAENYEEAVALANESLALSLKTGSVRRQIIAYVLKGFALLNLKKVDEAEKAFSNALNLCYDLKENFLITYPLLGLSQVALIRGDLEKGIYLSGAVERHTERSGTPVVPTMKFFFKETEKTITSLIEEATFNKWIMEGRELSIEEACTLARGVSEGV